MTVHTQRVDVRMVESLLGKLDAFNVDFGLENRGGQLDQLQLPGFNPLLPPLFVIPS